MTLREENLVNIAMRAGEMLQAGMIERDDVSGHAGLTADILQMAEEFEWKFEGIDWNESELDYWEEIDRFSETELIERYGQMANRAMENGQGTMDNEGVPEFANSGTVLNERGSLNSSEALQIKVIVEDGIVQEVLKDNNVPVQVEVVDVDTDYEDRDALIDYRDSLYADSKLMKCEYSVADFTDDTPPTVGDVGGRTDDMLPDGYFDALDWYCNQVGDDIESDLVRRFAEELVDCYRNKRDISEFISWTLYEGLIDEKFSYEESVALDMAYNEFGFGDEWDAKKLQEALRGFLAKIRDDGRKISTEVRDFTQEQGEDPVKVYAVSAGGVRREFYSGDLDECKLFCENHNWVFKDENYFEWDLEMEDSREGMLPEEYFYVVDEFSRLAGFDIENEFVRQHAEELVSCFENGKEIEDFDYWCQYEVLLGERFSLEAFEAIAPVLDVSPFEITEKDERVTSLREALERFREIRGEVTRDLETERVSEDLEKDFNVKNTVPVTVYAVSGSCRNAIFVGDFDECESFCKDYDWQLQDGNDFVWDLEMEDERDFPEGYFDAVDHYAYMLGCDIENEYMRQHAEELTVCYQKGLHFSDYDFWCRYEELLGEKITVDEFQKIDAHYSFDPNEVELDDQEKIESLKMELWSVRFQSEREAKQPSLEDAIQNAENVKSEPGKGEMIRNERERE